MMITKSMLERLRMQRSCPQPRLDYRPGGSLQTGVDKRLHTLREKQIVAGERALHSADQKFQTQQSFASRKGLAKAQFNHSKPTGEITP